MKLVVNVEWMILSKALYIDWALLQMNGKELSAAEGAELVQGSIPLKLSLCSLQTPAVFKLAKYWMITCISTIQSPGFSVLVQIAAALMFLMRDTHHESFFSQVSHINTKLFQTHAACAISPLGRGATAKLKEWAAPQTKMKVYDHGLKHNSWLQIAISENSFEVPTPTPCWGKHFLQDFVFQL